MKRINTVVKQIINHYELDTKTGTPKMHTDIDSFRIVMGEFGGKLEFQNTESVTPHAEYTFENGLKVWAGFNLNEFKQYQLNHLVFGK
jgi:hypothetical protein